MAYRSLPVWGAWIEILIVPQIAAKCHRSLPVWGAWIEIAGIRIFAKLIAVAPRVGSVD